MRWNNIILLTFIWKSLLSWNPCYSSYPSSNNLQLGERGVEVVHRPLIEECSGPSEVLGQSTENSDKLEQPLSPVMIDVFEQIADPLIPVRGHALIMLSRLLESRDPCVQGHEERIFQVSFILSFAHTPFDSVHIV